MTTIHYSASLTDNLSAALRDLAYTVGNNGEGSLYHDNSEKLTWSIRNPSAKFYLSPLFSEDELAAAIRILTDFANCGVGEETVYLQAPLSGETELLPFLQGVEVIRESLPAALGFARVQAYLPAGLFSRDDLKEFIEAEAAIKVVSIDTSGYDPEIHFEVDPEKIPLPERNYLHLLSGDDNRFGSFAFRIWRGYGNLNLTITLRDGVLVHEPDFNAEGGLLTRYGYRESLLSLSAEGIAERVRGRRAARRRALLARFQSNIVDERNREIEARLEVQEKSRDNLESFRSKRQPVPDDVISSLPFVPNGITASRTWGIEVETGAGSALTGTPAGWDAKGDGSLRSSYEPAYIEPEDCPEYADDHREEIEVTDNDTGRTYNIENPEYVDPDYCDYCGDRADEDNYDDDNCVELVSPILRSMHSRGLKQITRDLEDTPYNDSAGIHVHVEARDLTVAQMAELVMSYDHIEHFIEKSYHRTERGYCKRRAARELLEVVRQSRKVKTLQEMRKGDRYVTLNLQALDAHGTVEFRAMGPHYNYEHLVRWAMFCREMVNVAAAGVKAKRFAKAKTWADVTAILAKYGKEYSFASGEALAEQMSADEDALVSV